MLSPFQQKPAATPVASRHACRSRPWSALVLGGLLASALACPGPGQGAESAAAKRAAQVTLRDVNGAPVRPLAETGQSPTLLFFLMHDCPVANSYAPEINRIVAEYPKARSFVVYVENDLSPEAARAHARDYGFKCQALLDPDHQLVKVTGAKVSPEAALWSPARELVYRGRIDDRVADLGKRRVQPTRRDLRLALDAFLAGQPVPDRRTKAVGCYIPESTPVKPVKTSTPP